MSDRIEPALSAGVWVEVLKFLASGEGRIMPDGSIHVQGRKLGFTLSVGDSPATRIALLNHVLSADDPRKITRAMVTDIREAGGAVMAAHGNVCGYGECGCDKEMQRLEHIADVLESYLPAELPEDANG